MFRFYKTPEECVTLADLRAVFGMTQEDLAAKLGTHQETISNWERGKHIPAKGTIHMIAEAMNLPVPQIKHIQFYSR